MTLTEGAEGPHVEALQRLVNMTGVATVRLKVDGKLGPLTMAALLEHFESTGASMTADAIPGYVWQGALLDAAMSFALPLFEPL